MQISHTAHRIRDIMKRRGLTQKDLSELLNVSQPAISLYLQGRIPPAEVLYRIAQLDDTTIEWVLTGRKSEPVSNVVKESKPLYGNEHQLLELWKQLPGQVQQSLLKLMTHVAAMQQKSEKGA